MRSCNSTLDLRSQNYLALLAIPERMASPKNNPKLPIRISRSLAGEDARGKDLGAKTSN